VPLATRQGNVGVLPSPGRGMDVCSVDQNVIAGRWAGVLGDINQLVSGLIVVITDRESAKINIVGQRGRAVDDDGPDHSVGILGREVRMVPRCTVLVGKEGISLAATRWDGALGDTISTVMEVCVELTDAMPMNGSSGRGRMNQHTSELWR